MKVLRYLVIGIMFALATATLAQAQTGLRDECQGTEIIPEDCEGGGGGPVSEEIVVEDPVCPPGVSCSIETPDYDLMCLEQGFGRYHGYLGHTRFRVFGRTIVICWWMY